MVGVQAQFHIFVHWELAESTLHVQDPFLPTYGESTGTVPHIRTLGTS
jgi:hypothetical protein